MELDKMIENLLGMDIADKNGTFVFSAEAEQLIHDIAEKCNNIPIVHSTKDQAEIYAEGLSAEDVYMDMCHKIISAPTRIHMTISARMLIPVIDKKLRERNRTNMDKSQTTDHENVKKETIMQNDRYGFEFQFQDGGWNIIMFDEKGQCHRYYVSDEHDIDPSQQHLGDYVTNSKNLYRYNIPTYDEFNEKVDDIFSLENKQIEAFSDYMLPVTYKKE